MSFYADLIPAPVRVRVSHYILRYDGHYTEYRNNKFVRSVDYRFITLQ